MGMAMRDHDRSARAQASRRGPRSTRVRAPENARSCVGCGVRAERPKGSFEMVRFALLPRAAAATEGEVAVTEVAAAAIEGEVAVTEVAAAVTDVAVTFTPAALTPVLDLAGKSFGRGAWVHPTRRCLEEAARRGFARAAKREVSASFDGLATALEDAAGRRVHELIAVGVRSRKVAFGTTAVAEANSRLTLVAVDAAALRESEVAKALASGLALAFGSKRSLGEACGRDVVGMVAIIDESLAIAVRGAVSLSLAAAMARGT